MQELSRRTFLAGVGGSIATGWFAVEARDLFAAAAHAAIAGAQQPRPAFQVLTLDQAADIDAFTAQIIPTDETPARAKHTRCISSTERSRRLPATFDRNSRRAGRIFAPGPSALVAARSHSPHSPVRNKSS